MLLDPVSLNQSNRNWALTATALTGAAAVLGTIFLSINFNDIVHTASACYGTAITTGIAGVAAIVLASVANHYHNKSKATKESSADTSPYKNSEVEAFFKAFKIKPNETVTLEIKFALDMYADEEDESYDDEHETTLAVPTHIDGNFIYFQDRNPIKISDILEIKEAGRAIHLGEIPKIMPNPTTPPVIAQTTPPPIPKLGHLVNDSDKERLQTLGITIAPDNSFHFALINGAQIQTIKSGDNTQITIRDSGDGEIVFLNMKDAPHEQYCKVQWNELP